MPSSTSSNVPPHRPSVRTGRMLTLPATPAMPMPLLVFARDQARDEKAVEEAAVRRAALAVAPVAFIARIGIARIAVAGATGIGDEVVAGQHAADQVGVRQDAGIDHRDRDARGTRLQRPRRLDVDAGDRTVQCPLLRIERVVRRGLADTRGARDRHTGCRRPAGRPAPTARAAPASGPLLARKHRRCCRSAARTRDRRRWRGRCGRAAWCRSVVTPSLRRIISRRTGPSPFGSLIVAFGVNLAAGMTLRP